MKSIILILFLLLAVFVNIYLGIQAIDILFIGGLTFLQFVCAVFAVLFYSYFAFIGSRLAIATIVKMIGE